MGLGLLFYILLGFRYEEGKRFRVYGVRGLGFRVLVPFRCFMLYWTLGPGPTYSRTPPLRTS